ncbi:MAG: peptide chain release factor N(5)-glutamine methyltransferase [Bacteroidetes bacterium]|nr:peptide chain release factor N(5)-glutamine methyltransferase [Bacteroidota bacterium]
MKKADHTVNDIRRSFLTGLKDLYDADEINSILYLLFEEFLGWTKPKLHVEPGARLCEADSKRFSVALVRLSNNCPVQYILGKADFNGLTVFVNPSVLIPRPETAELATMLAQDMKTLDPDGFSALDIGTGSGCIAIYLKKQFPAICIHGTDISEEALSTARSNAILHNAEIEFYRADILKGTAAMPKYEYNLIISNPPYVTMKEREEILRNVKDYEPFSALFVPDADPLVYYRAITQYAQTGLAGKGMLYLEINEAFGNELKELLCSTGFSDVSLLKDFRGRDRFLKAVFRSRS